MKFYLLVHFYQSLCHRCTLNSVWFACHEILLWRARCAHLQLMQYVHLWKVALSVQKTTRDTLRQVFRNTTWAWKYSSFVRTIEWNKGCWKDAIFFSRIPTQSASVNSATAKKMEPVKFPDWFNWSRREKKCPNMPLPRFAVLATLWRTPSFYGPKVKYITHAILMHTKFYNVNVLHS